jgi:hypothetical protein
MRYMYANARLQLVMVRLTQCAQSEMMVNMLRRSTSLFLLLPAISKFLFQRGAARITRGIRQRGSQTAIYSDDVCVDSKPTSRNLSLRNRIKSPQLLLTSSSAAITADDVVHRTHCSQRTQPADKVLAVRGLYTNYARRGSRGCAQKNG